MADQLRALVARGMSDAQVAAALGVTRNIVNGKRRRLGIRSALTQGDGPKMRQARKSIPVDIIEEAPKLLMKVPPKAANLPPLSGITCDSPAIPPEHHGAGAILALGPRSCRWPVGDARDPGFRFCAAPKAGPLSSYCPTHEVESLPERMREQRAAELQPRRTAA
jgi:GcrA cell cycle regulator